VSRCSRASYKRQFLVGIAVRLCHPPLNCKYTMLDSGQMPKHDVTEAVKNLKVDKSEFDAAMKKLIATPPIRAPKPAAKRHRAVRRKPSR
jgi:hypothetical protein